MSPGNEDPRKTGLKNGLRQLTNEQLQNLWYYPDEMVLDSFNYEDGKFCPLAVALDLDKIIVEPTHNIVFDFLTKLGFKVYNTRGIKGEFYTTERKRDLEIAVGEVLKERLVGNMLESAYFQARNHKCQDPNTLHIFYFPHEQYIRLLEVTPDVATTGEVFPFRFAERPEWHLYYQSCITLLSPEEWEMVLDGRLKLPEGWDKETAQDLLLTSGSRSRK